MRASHTPALDMSSTYLSNSGIQAKRKVLWRTTFRESPLTHKGDYLHLGLLKANVRVIIF